MLLPPDRLPDRDRSYLLDPPDHETPVILSPQLPAPPALPQILPATVESIDQVNALAFVRPSMAPDTTLLTYVSEAIPMELVHPEDRCLIATYNDNLAVLIALYRNPFSWPVSARTVSAAAVNFTLQAYTAWAALSTQITIRETCFLWTSVAFTWSCAQVRNPAARFRLAINTVQATQILTAGTPAADNRFTFALSQRSLTAYAPGTYTVDVHVYVENAGDTVTTRTGQMTVWATPN